MRSIFLILFSCLLFAACSSDDDKKITSIEPEFSHIEIEPSNGFQIFQIKHHPSSAPAPKYGFEISNTLVAVAPYNTDNYSGFIVGTCKDCGEGKSTITIVTDEWIEAKIEVVVKKKAN